ncbi:putative beta-D-xylosidase 2-like isoform X1 [Hibiscus syriacus]|uniref:Beta-D-xylosidase 2-like isoform X1 n=1 Tax=Hibiscus syriacus TaxID=106335 RepID=A0A6A2WPE8_HIBSY|nr:putative beta-D-xylosidase 2-like isoform X1 [Hibiscus syriacus]
MALELKARSLLHLRRFREVADMLQDYIPSLKMSSTEESGSLSSDNSSQRVKLLPSDNSSDSLGRNPPFKCFSILELKKKVMVGLLKNCEKEGQWRNLVLGQACCHLGLMEDAMVLLQTGKRLASAAFRRKSVSLSEDSFSLPNTITASDVSTAVTTPPSTPPRNQTPFSNPKTFPSFYPISNSSSAVELPPLPH